MVSAAPLGGVESVELIDAGPLVATLRVVAPVRRSRRSCRTPRCAPAAHGWTSTFDVDWHEDEQLLSLDGAARRARRRRRPATSSSATCCGPTHPSSPWDAAKFEVCAHRFVDLAEPSFGVAVLNDGRYGHGLFDGGVRVSLLRAAKYPDPTADHGRHRVTISVLPARSRAARRAAPRPRR